MDLEVSLYYFGPRFISNTGITRDKSFELGDQIVSIICMQNTDLSFDDLTVGADVFI